MAKGLTTLSSPKRKMIHARLWRRDVMVDLSSVISASQLCDVLVSGVGESFVDWSGSFRQRLQPSFSHGGIEIGSRLCMGERFDFASRSFNLSF